MGTVEPTHQEPGAAMARLASRGAGRCIPAVDGLASLLLAVTVLSQPLARAQVADVVRPDARGDYRSIRIAGPRGSTPQRFWLVVDRDPRGLLCRDRQGRAWIALRYGSVVQLVEPEQQNEPMRPEGKPTLLVDRHPC